MDMHPDFKKLIDQHAEAAIEKRIKPEAWYSKVFWGVVASVLAAGLIALATSIYSGGSDCHAVSHQENTTYVGIGEANVSYPL